MRSSLLDPLLTPTRQALLAATILQPEKRWYFRELARYLRVRPSNIQRDLAAFTEAGLLQRHQDGNRVYYQAHRPCPIFGELEQILIKTVGIVEMLHEILRPVQRKIDVAFIYGSIASGEARADSDIDVMIIGSVGLAEIARLFQGIERRLGRQVNPAVYTAVEFRRRVNERSHFIRTVLGVKLLFVQGSQNDLEKLAQKSESKTPQNQPRRTSRSPRRGGTRSQRRET
ncbi:MAG TPA: nucleotidyltransferase domain-containing protein [Terriglobia bacterium]|nr:nucleotidyltransferase domain-containing protein [Terriglobia bacterium]